MLCDFGLSRIRFEVTRTHTNIREGGRLRYLAPELSFGPESFRTTEASDIYSLSMTLFCLLTLCTPFEDYRNDMAAADAARRGVRPRKVERSRFLTSAFGMLWELLESMWAENGFIRPSVWTVVMRLREILPPPVCFESGAGHQGADTRTDV